MLELLGTFHRASTSIALRDLSSPQSLLATDVQHNRTLHAFVSQLCRMKVSVAANLLQASPILPAGRHLLKDISENSQEGIDSSIGHSSSSHHSHMAASAFAAVSQVLGFQADPEDDQEDDQDHLKLDGVDSAQADEQAAQHEEGQAKSPTPADGNSQTASQGDQQQTHQMHSTTDRQPAPLTADSLKTLASSTEDDQPSIASAVAAPDQDLLPQSPEPATKSPELATAGSTAGSQTFDAELHDSVAALVQAPGNTGSSSQQPAQPPKGVSDPSVDALILQSLKEDVTSPASGSSSHAFDAALQDGVSAAVTTGVTAEPGDCWDSLALAYVLG